MLYADCDVSQQIFYENLSFDVNFIASIVKRPF